MINLTKPNTLSQADFGALTADQVRQIPTASLASLDQTHYGYLTSGQVAAMSAAQITALKHPEWLTPAAVGGLSAQQVSSIASTAWGQVSSAWMNGLTTDAFAAVPAAGIGSLGAAVIRGLSDADFQAMTAAQFAAIADNDWIPLSAVAKLRPDQVQTTTDWDSTSARWLNALSPEAFAAIPAAGINQMSLAALQGLDATRRAIALKSADEMHAGYIDMASKDASVNYDSVLANLQLMCSNIGSGGLSAAQFDAFNNTLAAAKGASGNPTYVSSLMGSMGVQLNMSADAFNQAVCKWFLGTNNPTAKGYADVSDSALFNGSVQQAAVGVAQGQIGDCWLISSLEALAATAPERLNGLISANGNGTYAVKFYNGSADKPVFVTVDGKVANYGASTSAGGWARLIEDAFVEACSSGLLQADGYTNWKNDMGQLDGGVSARAMKTLTGGTSKSFSSGAAGWDAVKAALEDGSGIVTYASYGKDSKDGQGKTQMVSGHAFAITGIDEANHKYIFRNPWGSNYVFELSPDELDAISGKGEFVVMESPIEYGSAAAHFAGTDWTTVSADWINGQSAAMIAAIPTTALKQLCGSTVNGLSAWTLQTLSVDQLTALPHLDRLSASAVAGLLTAQTKALGADWYNGLSAAAVAALPVASIGSLSQTVLQGLDGAAIGAMTPQQVAAIAHPDWLSPAGASGLTAAQIAVLDTSWSYQSADWFNALSPAAVAAMPVKAIQNMSSAAFQGLAAATIHAMTPQQVAAFAHPDKLSVAAFGGLTAAQVPSISISWYWMSAAQLNALSPEAFAAIPAAGINQMTKAALQGLDATHRSIALRSADADHANDIKTAPVLISDWSQVTAADVNALSPQQLAGVAPADLQTLPEAAIRGLSTATVAALSPQQIAAIAHPDWMSTDAFSGLTAAQVPAVAISWGWMSAAQINAMSPAAIAALPAQAIKDIEAYGASSGLSASTIHAMTAQQIGAMEHPDWLSASAFSGMTATQVPAIAISWGWMSADQLNTLSADAFAAIPAAGVNQMSKASLQGLDATHHDLALKRADATHAGYLTPAPVSSGGAATLVQAMAGFNVPAAVTTGAQGHMGAHAPFTLVKAH
ncbi:C2 family cysteine protease [Roseateles sp. L2-2]|uniref:C2 family cysteine protease n=1 Tax=Roseateles sp. L2-2 TaxID=3422597 RepID=UPI003D35D94A